MKATGHKNFLTSMFAFTALFAVMPAMAAVEEYAAAVNNGIKFLETTIMLPVQDDNSQEKLPDADLAQCTIKSDNEDCLSIINGKSNPITYKSNTKNQDLCLGKKITISCKGYKKEELSWYGTITSPWKTLTLEKSNNIFNKIGGGISQAAGAVGNAAQKGANAVGGIFKGSEPCTDEQIKALKESATNKDQIEKTQLNKDKQCVVSKCAKNYVPNDAKNGCEQSEGACTPTADNATAGELKKGKCIITDCGNGWHPSDDGTKCDQAELSEADSKAKVDELRDNAQKMKDKEQSTANKMLGAAAIGATGIGAMNMMSGLAEQNADDSAEEDMRAYLATFVCDYGTGRNIKGGERDIDLPGGNELFAQVNEYKTLAADLKVRKEALGKTPGIESEIIYDIAETGLYDNVGTGRQSGAYASVSRALMDENSEDAARWNELKQSAHDKKNTGLKTAAAGALGGLVGNLAINSGDKNKNKVNEINNKYKNKALVALAETTNSTPPHNVMCPDGKTVRSDNLQCACAANQQYNPNQNTCDPCTGGQISDGTTQCKCPESKPLWDSNTKTCITHPETCTPECQPTEGDHLRLLSDGCSCTCTDGYDFDDATAKCVCRDPKTENSENGQCEIVRTEITTVQTNPEYETIVLNASAMFKIGTANFVDGSTIESDLQKMYNAVAKNQTCKLFIQGYTDPVGSESTNKTLSQRRANAIETAIKKIIQNDTAAGKPTIEISAIGQGETNCTCKVAEDMKLDISDKLTDKDYSICANASADTSVTGNQRFAPCRRIEVTTNCKSTGQTNQ